MFCRRIILGFLISIMDHIEEQQLQSKFLLVIFFVSAISVITGMVSAIRNNNMQGGSFLNMIWLCIILFSILGGMFYFMFHMTLVTEVNKNGFHYRFFPIIRRKKVIDYSDMISWQLKSKQDFKERMNIGYRKNTFAKKTSFMMGSDEYLEIITKTNHTYIFSTTNYYSLTSALRKYCSQKEI